MTTNTNSSQPVKKKEYNLMIRKFPRHLRDKFKAKCALRGKTMYARIIELIEQDTKEASK